jgi:hypothetical protein
VARFLSPAWLAELDAAVRDHPRLGELTADVRIVIEQRVTGAPDPDGSGRAPDGADPADDVVYHVVLDHGSASVAEGPAADPTVTFTQDVAVARSIATGEESAQRAFMSGQLRLGGDLQLLTAHQGVLSELGDVFASVRATTEFGTQPADAEPMGTEPAV